MLAVDNWLQTSHAPVQMIMQVHDELVFEIQETELTNCTDKIKQLMSHAADLTVPLVVDVGVGNNWDEAH
jgi:DNA polymerase-1